LIRNLNSGGKSEGKDKRYANDPYAGEDIRGSIHGVRDCYANA
jgi:hypothetical protein